MNLSFFNRSKRKIHYGKIIFVFLLIMGQVLTFGTNMVEANTTVKARTIECRECFFGS